jgi:hypothetical protein
MLFVGLIDFIDPEHAWPTPNANLLAGIRIKIQTVHITHLA